MGNYWLGYISDLLGPVAFTLGGILTVQAYRMRNEVCLIFALMLMTYQARNVVNSGAVWFYSAGLVRPSGLLIWSLAGRLIEISGTILTMLYFAGKLTSFAEFMTKLCYGTVVDRAGQMQSGEMPLEYWSESHYKSCVRALHSELRPELFNPKQEVTNERSQA